MYMMLWNDFPPIICMYISCVGLCVHVFMNLMLSWFVFFFFSDVLTYCVMLQAFICYCSYVSCLWCVCVSVCVCVCVCVHARVCVVVVIVHWHCSAQLSMFNMEKRCRNKIIIIIMLSNPQSTTLPGAWGHVVSARTSWSSTTTLSLR